MWVRHVPGPPDVPQKCSRCGVVLVAEGDPAAVAINAPQVYVEDGGAQIAVWISADKQLGAQDCVAV